MGYTHILAFDHVLGANPERPGGWKGPYTYRHVFHEPFVLFGFRPPSPSASSWSRESSSFRSGRPRWWRNRRRQWTCSPWPRLPVLVWESGGIRSSSRRSARISTIAESASREQIAVMRALWAKELVTVEGQWHLDQRRRDRNSPLSPLDPI